MDFNIKFEVQPRTREVVNVCISVELFYNDNIVFLFLGVKF